MTMAADRSSLFQSDNWIAAEAQGTEWTFWAMSGDTPGARRKAHLPQGSNDPGLSEIHAALCGELTASQLPIVACGTGLAAPQAVPTRPDQLPLAPQGSALPPETVLITLPGLAQEAPPAIMQGAETCIAGFLALNPSWDGVLCLPGKTTHWALISADEVVSFQSFLTVELAESACAMAGLQVQDWAAGELTGTVADTMSKPELMAARLAEAKAAMHGGSCTPEEATGRIWGAVLGAELAAARPYWLGQNLALIGEKETARPYAAALEMQGLPVTIADAERMTLAGLTRAWRSFRKADD